MNIKFVHISIAVVGLCSCATKDLKQEILSPVSFNKVELNDSFWAPRIEIQKEVLVPFALKKVEPAIYNLKKTASYLAGDSTSLPNPHRFVASDLYKVMEGVAYVLKRERDPALEAQMDTIIDIIAAAQAQDGYHYESHITGVAKNYKGGYWGGAGMGDKPYSWVLHSHELYNMGHMYEGAIAYYQATGKRKWLDVAIRNAQHINKVFFVGDPNYNGGKAINQAPGHQEIELALVKLFRETNDSLYLSMAKRFLDIRGVTYETDGTGVMSASYAQQHLPVRQQTKAVGHAVRATYQYSAMADVCNLCGDMTMLPALDSVWRNIVDTRMHITGGLGAVHGIEGFGPEYELPNKEAHLETCSAVGNVLFNHRMFLMSGDAKYMDVAEIALFNNVIAGINLAGNAFFYVNPLESDGRYGFNKGRRDRSPWFSTACCPSNLARLIPQISGFFYSTAKDELYVTLYGTSNAEVLLNDEKKVALTQRSGYPYDEKIEIELTELEQSRFSLNLRIPTWMEEQFVPGDLYRFTNKANQRFSLLVNGKKADYEIDKGFAKIDRVWRKGDVVELTLPMEVRFSRSHSLVEANKGRTAISRGPLLYCAEFIDNPHDLNAYVIDKDIVQEKATINTIDQGELEGIKSITLANELRLVPYYSWNNRGIGQMLVWFADNEPLAESLCKKQELKPIYNRITASHTHHADSEMAIGDGIHPSSSSDKSIPRWTSYPELGKEQSVEIVLKKPTSIQSIGIYWYDDNGGVKTPKEWRVEYKTNGEWKPFQLYTTDDYGTAKDQFNVIHPAEPIKPEAIKVIITPQKDSSVGILEADIKR